MAFVEYAAAFAVHFDYYWVFDLVGDFGSDLALIVGRVTTSVGLEPETVACWVGLVVGYLVDLTGMLK